ncbi:hypothetical protein CUMW_003220 [Citrus unshiu]|nr:hypothetical protein CUMW_003220 [Citrus unshiu]
MLKASKSCSGHKVTKGKPAKPKTRVGLELEPWSSRSVATAADRRRVFSSRWLDAQRQVATAGRAAARSRRWTRSSSSRDCSERQQQIRDWRG